MYLPTFFSVRNLSLELSGMISFGLTIFNLTQILLKPISFLALSRAVYNKNNDTKYTFIAVVIYSKFSAFVLFFSTDLIIHYFLGADFLKVSFLIKLISFAVLLFGVFLCLRSTIDALFDMAINSLNCFIALISFLSIYYSLTFFNVNEVYNILIPFIISLNILSIRTVLILYKYFKRLLP
ncbi:hypothetical protein N8960_00415 [bacterium]|nr:hypothetical protein [bacterium]